MKIRRSFFALLIALFGLTLVACNNSKGPDKTETGSQTETPTETGTSEETPTETGSNQNLGTLKIWVGSESVAFYTRKMNEYVAAYKVANGKDFPGTVEVVGMDTGSAAAQFLADTEAGADIFTVAHDNLGKLLEGSGAIDAVTNNTLLGAMLEQNPDAFLDVCYLQAGDGSAPQFYAVPVISQALVLYYNKAVFTGKEDKLASWEGILEVARENNALATSYSGTDGYNYSHFLLAQPFNDQAKDVFGASGSLEIYKNALQKNCYAYGDDQVAFNKYAQRFTLDPNGRNGTLTSTDGFAVELSTGKAITFVGGAWHLGTVTASLGEDNVGIVELPTFTLTEADAYGTATAGMTFHSGSFADCKCFVKKKGSAFAAYLDDILLFLSSDAVQKESFEECDNLPASQNVDLGDDALAKAQVAQSAYGIAQPFGFKAKYNTYYYSSGAPDMYVALHQNTGSAYSTDAEIIKTLQTITHVWAKGKLPADDAALAEFVAGQGK